MLFIKAHKRTYEPAFICREKSLDKKYLHKNLFEVDGKLNIFFLHLLLCNLKFVLCAIILYNWKRTNTKNHVGSNI